jgi:hypothetical protein
MVSYNTLVNSNDDNGDHDGEDKEVVAANLPVDYDKEATLLHVLEDSKRDEEAKWQ